MAKITLLKLIAFLAVLAGGYFAYKKSPDFIKKIKPVYFQPAASEKAENAGSQDAEEVSRILGDQAVGNLEQRIAEEVRNASLKVINSEVVKETKTQINQIVEKKVEEIKELPEEQISKIKKEIKREICQEILKDD